MGPSEILESITLAEPETFKPRLSGKYTKVGFYPSSHLCIHLCVNMHKHIYLYIYMFVDLFLVIEIIAVVITVIINIVYRLPLVDFVCVDEF